MVHEYFGRPLTSQLTHKLGQVLCTAKGQLRALRSMRAGTQLHDDFTSLRDAEEWIAQCDTWGPLETEHL